MAASMIRSSNSQDCQRKQYCSAKQKLQINRCIMEWEMLGCRKI
jgi:hypothetical protein